MTNCNYSVSYYVFDVTLSACQYFHKLEWQIVIRCNVTIHKWELSKCHNDINRQWQLIDEGCQIGIDDKQSVT